MIYSTCEKVKQGFSPGQSNGVQELSTNVILKLKDGRITLQPRNWVQFWTNTR